MQKFIRIALPCVCFAVMVWFLLFNGSKYLGWNGLIGVVGIGAVCIVVLCVKLHKLQQKQKEEHLCLLKKQAEEAVAPELEKVKGNSLKKEMIKRRYFPRSPNSKVEPSTMSARGEATWAMLPMGE